MAQRQPARNERAFAEQLSPHGHRMDEVASALQKSIRRGLEEDALYWAVQLDTAGYGGYCWKRLRAIASEDVGLADPQAAVIVRALYENWLDARKGKVRAGDEGKADPHARGEWVSGARLYLIHAVLVLVRAPKSRIVDHAVMVFYEGDPPRMEIPEWALDKHTRRGRQLGRGHAHFFEEGALLAGKTLPDPYRERGRAAREHGNRPSGAQLELGDPSME
jgi:replication-associated recombination protein RarA